MHDGWSHIHPFRTAIVEYETRGLFDGTRTVFIADHGRLVAQLETGFVAGKEVITIADGERLTRYWDVVRGTAYVSRDPRAAAFDAGAVENDEWRRHAIQIGHREKGKLRRVGDEQVGGRLYERFEIGRASARFPQRVTFWGNLMVEMAGRTATIKMTSIAIDAKIDPSRFRLPEGVRVVEEMR